MSLFARVSPSGLSFFALLAVGLVVSIVYEVRRWRQLGDFLSKRQKIVRSVNFAVITALLVDIAVLAFDLAPPNPAVRIGLLGACMVLLVVIVVLVLWDLREIQVRRLGSEMEFYGEVARSMVEHARAKGRTKAPPPGPGAN